VWLAVGPWLAENEAVARKDEAPQPGLDEDRARVAVPTTQSGTAPSSSRSAARPSARASSRQGLKCEGSSGPRRGLGRNAARQVGAERQRPGAHNDPATGPRVKPVRKGVVGQRALRIDVFLDDLADRIGLNQVDPLEGSHDGLLGRGERRR